MTPDFGEPAWDLGPAPEIPMPRWGRDHWTTFAYIETRCVDHRGMLDHEQMRCDRQRHPGFYSAKRRTATFGTDADGARYPTRLKTEARLSDGTWGMTEMYGHDDYDCLGDAIREGLILVTMPQRYQFHFTDIRGYGVKDPSGDLIGVGLVTGLDEMRLMAAASFSLTPRGWEIASELRAFLAGPQHPAAHQFMPRSAASEADRTNGSNTR